MKNASCRIWKVGSLLNVLLFLVTTMNGPLSVKQTVGTFCTVDRTCQIDTEITGKRTYVLQKRRRRLPREC